MEYLRIYRMRDQIKNHFILSYSPAVCNPPPMESRRKRGASDIKNFQRVEKAFSPPRGAGIHRRPSRFPCALRPEIGAFLETGSLSPPLAAHRPFPLLGFPAHTLPYRYGEFTTLSTVSGRKYTPSAQLGSEPAADFTPAGPTRRSRY